MTEYKHHDLHTRITHPCGTTGRKNTSIIRSFCNYIMQAIELYFTPINIHYHYNYHNYLNCHCHCHCHCHCYCHHHSHCRRHVVDHASNFSDQSDIVFLLGSQHRINKSLASVWWNHMTLLGLCDACMCQWTRSALVQVNLSPVRRQAFI